MFIPNKYTVTYYAIIANANSRQVVGYVEKHHIIPKSLGGSNSKSNIVRLSAREHFICHRLLTKMTDGDNRRKMVYAMNMLLAKNTKQFRYVPTASTYSVLKEEFRQVNPFSQPGFRQQHSHTGKKRSDDTKQKMAAAWTDERRINNPQTGKVRGTSWNKGRKSPETTGTNNPFYGRKHTDEQKRKWSEQKKGINPRAS